MTPLTMVTTRDQPDIEQAVLETLRCEWRRSALEQLKRGAALLYAAGAVGSLQLAMLAQ